MTLPIIQDMLDSDGTPRDLTAQQQSKIKEVVLSDLYLFATVICDFQDLSPDLHGQLATLINKWGTPDHRRLMIQIPRGHFKSSLCTIANSLWQICKEPDEPVAIFNEKEENAAQWVRAIRSLAENSLIFQTLFADLLPPGIHYRDRERGVNMNRSWKWTDSQLQFQRSRYITPEPSISALGIGSAAAGRHWPKIIKDDIISEDAKNSPIVMGRAKDWFDNSFSLERPALGGMDLVVCTPWSYDDVYSHAIRRYGYRLYRRAAIEDDKPIFEDKFPMETLVAIRNADPYNFSAQFMCKPRPGKEQAFEYNWLRFGTVQGNHFHIEPASLYEGEDTPVKVPEDPMHVVPIASMQKAILVDPAPTEATDIRQSPTARSALIVEGIDYWGRRYILDAWADRVSPPDLISTIISKMVEWDTDTVGIEKVIFSVIYRYWLERETRQLNMYCRAIDLEPMRRTKDSRIQAKIGPFRKGHYYINRSIEPLFAQEYLEYPYGRTRDVLDALAYDDEDGVLSRPLSPEEAERLQLNSMDWTKRFRGIDPSTGY